jgi:Ca2+-binding RTX toxin-like protein
MPLDGRASESLPRVDIFAPPGGFVGPIRVRWNEFYVQTILPPPPGEAFTVSYTYRATPVDTIIVARDLGAGTVVSFDVKMFHDQLGSFFAMGDARKSLIVGGAGADTLRGGNGNDDIMGGGGNDSITGDNGNDSVAGGTGDDTLSGGNGDDTAKGGDGEDRLVGGAGNDRLDGEAGNDTLAGGDGNDDLFGDAGDDSLIGGAGNDQLHGGEDNDTLAGGEGDDVLVGAEGNDKMFGGTGNDNLGGGEGDDVVDGGTGNDFLNGGAGRDRLTGGAGNDTFVFDGINDGPDIITDFTSGQDRILFNFLPPGTSFVSGANPAVGAGPHVIHNTGNGRLFVDPDGAGGQPPVLIGIVGGAIAEGDLIFGM